jgi:hypothetical protein
MYSRYGGVFLYSMVVRTLRDYGVFTDHQLDEYVSLGMDIFPKMNCYRSMKLFLIVLWPW